MNDDHDKLVAKIQHFYDMMIYRIQEVEENALIIKAENDKKMRQEKCSELKKLIDEYSKVFETFLYKET